MNHWTIELFSDRVSLSSNIELLSTTSDDERAKGIASYSGAKTVTIGDKSVVTKMDFTAENILLPGAPGTVDDYLEGNFTQSNSLQSPNTYHEKWTCIAENVLIPYGTVSSDITGWHVSISFSTSDGAWPKDLCEQSQRVVAACLKKRFIVTNIIPCAMTNNSSDSFTGRIDFRW